MALFGVHVAEANESSAPVRNCLEWAASRLNLDERVALVLRDGERVEGWIAGFALATNTITVDTVEVSEEGAVTRTLEDIESIQYWRRGRLNPGWCLGGLLIGSAIGYALPGTSDSIEPGQSSDIGTRFGVVIGGSLGLVVGTTLSLLSRTQITIACGPGRPVK